METTTKIDKLKGAVNWDLWRIRIRALLAEKGLIDAIKTEKEFPEDISKKKIEEYKEKRESDSIKAAAIIRLNLGDSPLIQTKNIDENDARELYNRLEALYAPKGFSSEFLIAKELFSTTLAKEGNSIERYLTKIRGFTDELALKNKAIPTEIIVAYTLNNLTSEYDYIVAAITQNFRDEKKIDLDDLFSAIIDESRRLSAKEPKELALVARKNENSTKKRFIKCYNYGKKGHYAREYKEPKEENSADDSDERVGLAL
jgi:hypothetical protein